MHLQKDREALLSFFVWAQEQLVVQQVDPVAAESAFGRQLSVDGAIQPRFLTFAALQYLQQQERKLKQQELQLQKQI